LYAKEKLSKIRGYQAKHFSFNVDGGRCETCKGDGSINVEMVLWQMLNCLVKLVAENDLKKKYSKLLLKEKY
jgi:excinuclease ABC subunit A